MKIEEYYKIIDKAAENREDFPIPNRDARHASYLLKTLFHYAENEVRILTGGLFQGVFGDENLKEEAIKFLRKSPNVKLLVAFQGSASKEEVLSSSFLQSILADPERKGTIEIYDAKKDFPSGINHFSVADAKAFRYELDHETRRAVGNFGDSNNATVLSALFDKIISKAEKVFATT